MGLKVKDLKTLPPGSHRDQPNLFLMVKQDEEKTRRTWVFRYYNGGTEHQIGLGSFTKGVAAADRFPATPATSLQQAFPSPELRGPISLLQA